MKKLISLLLCVVLLLSAFPLTALEAAAADGSIALEQEISVRCTKAGTWKVYTFTPSEEGVYIFSSSGSLDTMGYIALEEGAAAFDDVQDGGGSGENFAVTYNMRAGTTYYLGSTVVTGSTGTYKIKIIKFEIDDGTIHPISLSTSTSVTTNSSKNVKFFSINPGTSGKYSYKSFGSYDTQGYVFDEDWKQIAYADGGGSAQNFLIELDLQAGKTYYVGYATTSDTNATFSVLLNMTAYIKSITLSSAPNKTKYIKDLDAAFVSEGTYRVELNLVGFAFRVNYSTGSSEVRKYAHGIRGLECEITRNLSAGENDIRFSYMSNSSSFKVSVDDTPVQSLTMVQAPNKTTYYEEDAETAVNGEKVFNITILGMLIHVLFKDGTTQDFTVVYPYGPDIEDVEYFHFDHMVPASEMTVGNHTFTLTYYGVPLEFTVNFSLNSDNWQYDIQDDAVTLTKYIGTDTQAVIPDMLGGYPVTQIGAGCFKDNTTLKTVRMSEQITSIGDKAFYGCSALKELTLPASLTSIGEQACFGLYGLEQLNWNVPNLAIVRNNNTFAYLGKDVPGGTTVDFGFTCTAIPQDAFYPSSTSYAPNIGKIIVGENVTSIGNNAFRDFAGLHDVEWNAIQITTAISAANNIWLNSGGEGSFEVTLGENVEKLPTYLFYAANATRCPRVSKLTALSKNTVLANNAIKANSAVSLTYYCHYNSNTAVNSVYQVCVDNGYNYVLLDSPVDRIAIISPLSKEEYIVGEDLDLTGLTIYAYYEDNSEEDVTDSIVISGFDKTVLGPQTVIFSYTFIDKTVTASAGVMVTEEPLALDYLTITAPAAKTQFLAGDNFDSTGLRVSAVFTNGMAQDVTDSVILSGYNMNEVGTQTVEVSYTFSGATRITGYEIVIAAVVLESIAVQTAPEKTEYVAGETLNVDGLKVIATYNSGSTADVTGYCQLGDADMTAKGTQSISVFYTENGITKSASFDIHVHNYVQSITIIAMPSKTQFVVGTQFSHIGIRVRANYENEDIAEVTPFVTFSGYDMNVAGEQTVIVTYEEDGISNTASYTIHVIAVEVERLQVTSLPTPNQYIEEEFHTAGFEVLAYYTNGSSEDVTQDVVLSGFDNTTVGTQTITATYTYAGKSVSAQFQVDVLNKSASALEIVTKPTKTAYLYGEDFISDGMQTNIVFDNGTKLPFAVSDLVFEGYDKTQVGTKYITASATYRGKTVSAGFYVSVVNYETGITVTPPARTAYFYGDALNTAGMSLSVQMADGSSRTVHSGYIVAGYHSTTLGAQTITVTYTSSVTGAVLIDTFGVTVSDYETALAIIPPTKTAYYYGESLNTAGMSATVSMAAGGTRSIALSELNISGYKATTVGTQSITASFKNAKNETLSAGFSVSVANYEMALSITAPTKTAYFYGEALNTAGMQVRVSWANGTQTTVAASSYTMTAYAATTLGVQTLTVRYTTVKGAVLTDTFTVSVSNFETALTVTAPYKTTYYFGESLDTAGLRAVATMADGTAQNVSLGSLSISGYQSGTLGTQSVTVSFKNAKGETLAGSFAVNVLNFEQSLAITQTGKTEYTYGEAFDESGLSAVITMANGSTVAVDKAALVISGYDPYFVGEQTVTVAYTNVKGEVLSDTYTVTLANVGTSIHVTAPTKVTYYYGDTFDTTGLSAVLKNVDDTTTPIDSSRLTLSVFDATKLGEQTIVVSYTTDGGQILKDSFKVTVLNFETGLSMANAGKTAYFYGDAFDTSEVQVSAVMADGSSQALETGVLTFSGYNANKAGEQTVTVSYTNAKGRVLTTAYSVSVMNFENSLMLTAPTKKQYFYGEDLDLTGMKVLAVMADRSVKTIDNSLVTLSGYDNTVLGEQQVTVSLTNAKGDVLSKTFKATVNNFEAFISVKAPAKTAYLYGEALNIGGMKVNATMADGSEKTLANASCTVSGYSADTLGEQEITVSYTNAKGEVLSDTFTAGVSNFETAITVTAPDKTEYRYGEALDLTGVVVTAVMADGSSRTAAASEWQANGYDAETLGAQTLTVTLTSVSGEVLSTDFSVSVANYLSALELGGTQKIYFLQNETFDSEGLSARAVYADGSRTEVSGDVIVAGYDTATRGEQTVTVSYSWGGDTVQATYTIKVESAAERADATEDTFVDMADITMILSTANFGKTRAEAQNPEADVNRDGVINILDVSYALQDNIYGQSI